MQEGVVPLALMFERHVFLFLVLHWQAGEGMFFAAALNHEEVVDVLTAAVPAIVNKVRCVEGLRVCSLGAGVGGRECVADAGEANSGLGGVWCRQLHFECLPLVIASHVGHLAIVRLLLARGADPALTTVSVQHVRCRRTPASVRAQHVWLCHVRIQAEGVCPLYAASMTGMLEVVHALLDRGASVSQPIVRGRRCVRPGCHCLGSPPLCL